MAMSAKKAAALGWTCTYRSAVSSKHVRWTHRDGSVLEHCGHPTAIRPWGLYRPDGSMVGAFSTLTVAMGYHLAPV